MSPDALPERRHLCCGQQHARWFHLSLSPGECHSAYWIPYSLRQGWEESWHFWALWGAFLVGTFLNVSLFRRKCFRFPFRTIKILPETELPGLWLSILRGTKGSGYSLGNRASVFGFWVLCWRVVLLPRLGQSFWKCYSAHIPRQQLFGNRLLLHLEGSLNVSHLLCKHFCSCQRLKAS